MGTEPPASPTASMRSARPDLEFPPLLQRGLPHPGAVLLPRNHQLGLHLVVVHSVGDDVLGVVGPVPRLNVLDQERDALRAVGTGRDIGRTRLAVSLP